MRRKGGTKNGDTYAKNGKNFNRMANRAYGTRKTLEGNFPNG